MLKLKLYFLLFAVLTAYSSMVRAETPGASLCSNSTLVCVCTTEVVPCGFVPPVVLRPATNINAIVFTFKAIDITVNNESALNIDNWGLIFSSPSSTTPGVADKFYCNAKNCANGAIKITANNAQVYVERGGIGQNTNRLTGTVVITLSKFKNGQLPSELQTVINGARDGAILITPTYSDNSDKADGSNPRTGTSYLWQADIGALLNPPALTVLSRANGLVVNINPPADLSSGNPNPVSAPVTITTVAAGNPSGYILAFWFARASDGSQPCSETGLWSFVPNPLTFNPLVSAPINPPILTCSYTLYDEDTMGIGGVSDALGCSSSPPTTSVPYYGTEGVPALTSDSVAVPATFNFIEKSTFLAKLIANPAKEYAVPGTCMTVVYVPGTQASYGKMGIKAGEIYGVTGWVLNTAYTTTDPTPNLSFSHSNLSYMTPGTATLASLAKDPSLAQTSGDCFVATAASGDINSNSVFYWRILRDEYLTDLGITKFYYKHGPRWADWLNKHPKYKPATHFVLEKTGAFFYFSTLYTREAWEWTSEHSEEVWEWTAGHSKEVWEWTSDHGKEVWEWTSKQAKIFFSFLSDIWVQEASADEPRSEETFHSDPSLHPDKRDPDLAIFPDQRINFDLALTAGVLFPTTDKNLYNKYYHQPTLDFELASNAMVWTSDLGWSLGLKGIYAQNSQKSVDTTLGSATQKNKRFLYFAAIELMAGVRYRNPHFLFLQPGIFAGAGVLRLREEGKAIADTGKNTEDDKDQTLGVSQFSPVFDFGANLDISLSTLFMYSERELYLSHDILLRLTAIYRINPSKALDMSGLVLNAGFAFLF